MSKPLSCFDSVETLLNSGVMDGIVGCVYGVGAVIVFIRGKSRLGRFLKRVLSTLSHIQM